MIEMNLNNSPAYTAEKSGIKIKTAAGILILIVISVLSAFTLLMRSKINRNSAEDQRVPAEQIVEIIIDSVSGDYHEIPVEIENQEEENNLPEKEDKFGKYALNNLLKSVSSEISYDTTITSDNKNFTVQGSSKNKNAVSMLLTILKENDWQLQPKPQTNIYEDSGIYYFRIETFGKNL